MKVLKRLFFSGLFLSLAVQVFASEADLAIPDLHAGSYTLFGGTITAWQLLFYGALVICGTLGISLFQFFMIKKEKAHESMLKVAEIIYQTCRTYLLQQGKFLLMLFAFIAVAMAFYFLVMKGEAVPVLLQILLFSVIGMGGSYTVAWYGIRVNTFANARTAFASLEGKPWNVVNIPLRAGMSVGLFLISLELVMMVIILLFVPRNIVGYCFLGFAIGESLGASALRIAGGIFTKIADIGSDLMKIVFKVKEDDPRNPGVIADCTGDNAGDSVGPTADGFETYGVTGVALISFITLAITVPDILWAGLTLPKFSPAAGVAEVSKEAIRSDRHALPGRASVEAHRLDLRNAVPHGLPLRLFVFRQPGDLHDQIQRQNGIRFRRAPHAAHLDRRDPLHQRILWHELSAPGQPRPDHVGRSHWNKLRHQGNRSALPSPHMPASGGSWP